MCDSLTERAFDVTELKVVGAGTCAFMSTLAMGVMLYHYDTPFWVPPVVGVWCLLMIYAYIVVADEIDRW